MLEDQVANLLQRYLGNYVRGLNKEALKISVWKGDVELTNMQLKPEALNALKLPVRVKAGFLGSVKLKVPWSRLGQEPVLVSLDRIFLLAEPSTGVEGCSEDSIQEAKKSRVREMEMRLLERAQQLKSEVNQSWLGSLINTIIGNLKLSISNIHIRYEDLESNPGHPFAMGLTLEKLITVTVDDNGKETFVTGGSLERIQKSVELEQIALYLDSGISPWQLDKPWENLLPAEWVQVFRFGTDKGMPANNLTKKHTYILQPVTGNAKYVKSRPNEHNDQQPSQKAAVNLDDVTLCLSKDGYSDMLKLADNFAAFNQRLKYAHFRPPVPIKSNPSSWWKYAYRAVSDQLKKASGKLSWEQVLKYAKLRKKYISLYAQLLKSDPGRAIADDNKEIEELDRELDIEVILQWRMLAHKFVERSVETDLNLRKQKEKKSWWSIGWSRSSLKDESEAFHFSEEDWDQLNRIIGYREEDAGQSVIIDEKKDSLHTLVEIHMKHNASKLIDESLESLAALSCENLNCSIKLYPETKIFDIKLGSYQLSSPNGLLAESATSSDSLVGIFCYKPFDAKVDWSMVAKASPCYVTYLKDSIEQVVKFFENSSGVSQKIALETAAAVQMTIDEVKRTAQQQMNRALKDHSRFLLDLDIAAPKITIPTDFRPDDIHPTKLLLDLGNLIIRTGDDNTQESTEETLMYLQFKLVLSDVSAFLVDGDYFWSQTTYGSAGPTYLGGNTFLPIIDRCGVILALEQNRLEDPSYPSTRIAVRLPSLGFHFSPARYHRLMQVLKIFQGEDSDGSDSIRPWSQADLEGWLSLLVRKGMGNREAVWQRRYLCLVGPFLYVLDSPGSRSYKQYISLRGKQVFQVPAEFVGGVDHVLAVSEAARSNSKVVEDANALIMRCDTDELRKLWQRRLQGAIYRASGSAPIVGLSESSSEHEDSEKGDYNSQDTGVEKVFITGILDELKICFYYNQQRVQGFMRVLVAEENCLFEFRAIGGQVELSVRTSEMLIGTVLRSLEIEDLVSSNGISKRRYLARSFIGSADAFSSFDDVKSQSFNCDDRAASEGDDKFYEASETLADPVDSPMQSSMSVSDNRRADLASTSQTLSSKPPSFIRTPGLLPYDTHETKGGDSELKDTLNSFVKAQITVLDHNSALYNNIDKQVTVTLATLSFFCRRPTILAIMEFVNAINTEDEKCESFSESSSVAIIKHDTHREDVGNDHHSEAVEESVVKGLLGKGKSRIIFSLTLKMTRAHIILMNEKEAKFATLLQDNLLADIKVFPSSFRIKAALGNLRISDDSLPSNHMYFWICDMRNPGGSSFVDLLFSSFSADDEDYGGYDYALVGELSEVRVVYLNRFIQEIVSYFTGLAPGNSKNVIKVKDQVTDAEKWFTTSEIEGSPAVKLDLSLRKPIIWMPRQTDSIDYLKLDIVQITVQNSFQWLFGGKREISAVHLDILTILIEDINLNVGVGTKLGESIIQEVKGVSVVIGRSLRDLLHRVPGSEVTIKIEEITAALSNREYQIITECAQANFSETPNLAPSLIDSEISSSEADALVPQVSDVEYATQDGESWITTKVSVAIDLVVLCLRTGIGGDTSLATVGVNGMWLLYKSNKAGDGFLSASLDGFTVIDDRVGTEEGLRLAIGKPEDVRNSPINAAIDYKHWSRDYIDATNDNDVKIVPTMLILDAKFSQSSSFMSLCVQRPQLLVALDFLLAVVEFFLPSIGDVLSYGDHEKSLALNIVDAVTLDQSVYRQTSTEMALSPQRPLIVDDERYNHFIYDGQGGVLYLKDRQANLSAPSKEKMIYVANGKRLQFKNVLVKDGRYLDSCIYLGTNSSYTALKDDDVYLEEIDGASCGPYSKEDLNQELPPNNAVVRSTEFTVELQAIGPELTFYSASKEVAESRSLILSNKLLHAQLDVLCRLVMKNDTIEMSANALGLTMESNGIRILEPFDTTLNYSNASGKTNIQLSVSDVFMNFSFSILKLFLAVEDDILAFLRMTSKKITVVCSQFDKVGTVRNPQNSQVYAFWRPRAPPGFAVLGDYLTPTEKPPTKGVIAINTNFARVKNPLSFRLVWPTLSAGVSSEQRSNGNEGSLRSILDEGDTSCCVWFPEAPKGYVALGCVVSQGSKRPPLSSVSCILASLLTPCPLRDCITIGSDNLCSTLAFWRVENAAGTFLPADPTTGLLNVAYELRHLMFPILDSPKAYESPNTQASSSHRDTPQPQRSIGASSCRRFEEISDFVWVWWNRGSNSGRRLSLWRPVVPQGMVYFGDIAVQGYEPPSTCTVVHDTGGEELFIAPLDFQLVGQIKKQKGVEGISFWMPQAPPGYVSLGCVASKSIPKQHDFSALRCIRSDMVSGDQFSEESLWDTSGTKIKTEPFSIWAIGNELGTFIVRSGFKKPPQRFALKLADLTNGLDDTVIDAEIKTFSAALFDDYGGLMVPLFNVSLSGLGFSLHGREKCINSTASFSLNVRSYNDKYEAWEPLVEPVDGFLRYQYDLNAPGAASQLRITSRRDLNLNVSVSNANMIIQAYASWSNLSHVHKSSQEIQQKEEAGSSTFGGGSIIGVHHKRDFFIIPRNKLGEDIFIRATEIRGLHNIIRMPSGVMKPLKVPVLKNMLDSHMKGKLGGKVRAMVTVLVADAQILRVEGSTSKQYAVTIRLIQDQSISSESLLKQQTARTRGIHSEHSSSSEQELVNWGEMFFFKVDSADHYKVELIVIDTGNGNPVGFSSFPLKQVAENIPDSLSTSAYFNKLSWMDLFSAQSMNTVEETEGQKLCGRIRCGILLSPEYEVENQENSCMSGERSGFIQISPSREGPWTTVRLNYAAPAACWRLGSDVIASEVIVKDGDRYVDIRSLVTVQNSTDITLDLCLKSKASEDRTLHDASRIEEQQFEDDKTEKDEFFQTEEYKPSSGWVSCSFQPKKQELDGSPWNEKSISESPPGWSWIDNWHLDKTSVTTADGWVYAPDVESLKWPESCDSLKSVNYARQRKWVRNRKKISGHQKLEISLGRLSPGDTVPLPLSGLQSDYVLQLRPFRIHDSNEYSWSSVVNKVEDSGEPKGISEICVSALAESNELLCCTPLNGTSSNGSQKLWFCVSIQATEVAKDIHSDPIQDWKIVIKAPLSLSNFLPFAAEFTVLEMQAGDHFSACARRALCPGAPVNVYHADIRNPLFLSLLPPRGWLSVHETILLSHPHGVPANTLSLRSDISGRVVQIILDQNYEREQPMLSKVIRVYAPYWFEIARCPPLTLRLIDMGGKKSTRKFALPFHSKKSNAKIVEEIAEEEIYDGHTIASALNFNILGLSVSSSGEAHFGPVKDLSLLGDVDGSLDINAYDADGKCVKLFVSTKPCPYQSIPTKVICIRPFITFTNRLGQDILLKLSCRDEAKVLRLCDSRVSFPYRDDNGPNKLQVRLGDTEWSYPIQITKEDTISLVLRTQAGIRKFLRTEIRGYEEGSRFIVVFRLGSAFGPIRMENRIGNKKISIRQAGFDDNYWIQMEPFSTTNFSWEDPYGQKFIEAKVDEDSSGVWKFDLEESGLHLVEQGELKIKFHVFEMVDVKVGRFIDDKTSNLDEDVLVTSTGNQGSTQLPAKVQNEVTPLELIVELGVLGVSLIDHRPKELSYLYLERVFISYSTSYDGGATTRFKLILGYLQIDNQLPLTLMPVLLAPEQATDLHHPVFKITVTVCNENPDGVVVYPCVYIRVTDKWWRLDIHEPIIWAVVDLYRNIQMDRLPQTSSVTQVDPEIRVNLIDISEVRLKVSLDTAPAQRPHGVLGVWSPVLSAVGNAFKIQLHLRRVMHKDRFMRKSSILPAIGNRIMRDLIHNPLHLLFSVDVLGMASSTLASLSRGFAELSTDGQFLQLRSKQVRSRRITGVSDGILQGTEALAQGVAFGVSGVVTKPMESAKQNGLLGLAHGVGRAFVGIVVQPVSGALDFFSMTVDGIGASCSKCLEVLNRKTSLNRIRNPRAIRSDGVVRDYCEREALGQMILYLAEASRRFGCTEIFKEPSKFASSDYYEEHFVVPYQRIVLVTNKRVMLLQCPDLDNMDKRPCKIMWDVPWQELMALELAKAGCHQPSHLILHLKNFRRSENFVRVIKCATEVETEGTVPQAVIICSVVRKMWKAYQSDMKCLVLKVPSSQRHVSFAWSEADGRETRNLSKAIVRLREFSSSNSASDDRKFVTHSINFTKIWSSKRETKGRCTLCRKQSSDHSGICSIWRPICPDGYVSIGDIARVGSHAPNCAAVYSNSDRLFALPIGYDLVWRNCLDDYTTPVSIWHPRAPEGFVSLGCVAVADFTEPQPDLVYCVAESLAEQTEFEEQKIWTEPDSYPWACHIYQIKSGALHFVALRQTKEESDWKPMRVHDEPAVQMHS
ncbi:uncharacterized protein LOC115736923 isoform X3 [Rhodamnia argentea]|uniref:Uncharacterized protein LOC115736923 isoform X3 n=1 Tax=Rhodamnia argentea TaxID=178133 RepID=A0ABM3HWK2_9MYRT|nr:uncharacterized protein LOC115736923 isoform X3 [Rhodamnia argentea]